MCDTTAMTTMREKFPLEQFRFHDKKLNFMDALAEIENAERLCFRDDVT